jgi:hypothetical protein
MKFLLGLGLDINLTGKRRSCRNIPEINGREEMRVFAVVNIDRIASRLYF